MQGTVLGGKYRLVREIAEGGMGVVWEAEHVQIGRKLAVKLLQGQLAKSPEAVARFHREAQIAGTLGHDHICPVLDLGQTEDGQHYLVMELLRGRSLAEALRAGCAFEVDRALDIAAQILDALAAAHAAGVVHRDLKPENVFLSRVGDRDDFVRVLDFGISKMTGEGGGPATALTRTGIVMGTAYYMAPEQARGHRDVDARVDLYATGAILYEMLTGRLAYDGDSVNDVIIKLVTEPFVPPRVHRPELPGEVEAVVLRAMARRREDRFATAAEMREEVRAVRSLCAASGGPTTASVMPAATSSSTPIGLAPSSERRRGEPSDETAARGGAGTTAPLAPTRSSQPLEGAPPPVSGEPSPGSSPAAAITGAVAWRLPRRRAPLVVAALAVMAAAAGLVAWLAAGAPGDGADGEADLRGSARTAPPMAVPRVAPATPAMPSRALVPAPVVSASSVPPSSPTASDVAAVSVQAAEPASPPAHPPVQPASRARALKAGRGAAAQSGGARPAPASLQPAHPSRLSPRKIPDPVRDRPGRDIDIVR